MELIIKNSFLGKHVYNELGKEVCQISSQIMNLTQKILLIDQQKTYISTVERIGKGERFNAELKLHLSEAASKHEELSGEASGKAEAKLYERIYHDLDIEDKRTKQCYHLHLESDTSWSIENHQHQKIGIIKKMDAHGNIKLECTSTEDCLLLCTFYIFTQYLMKENEPMIV